MDKAAIRAKAKELCSKAYGSTRTEIEAALTQVRQNTLLEAEGICMGSLTLENAVHNLRRLRIDTTEGDNG